MTRAGESVGKAVGTGLRAVRRGAVRAGQVGADTAVTWAGRAEEKLAERGVTADHLRGVVADRAGLLVEKAEEVEKSTRKRRKQLAKKAKGVRKDVVKATERARKEAKSRAKDVRKAAKQARKDYAAAQRPPRRRWPWVLGILVAGLVAGYVALTRRPEEVHLEEVDETEAAEPTPRGTTTAEHAARNGRVADESVTDRR
ncbi:hypothetical protein [Saccharothrix australiensis]|nr:hypothetical protein [Saccharothrix australiensis]